MSPLCLTGVTTCMEECRWVNEGEVKLRFEVEIKESDMWSGNSKSCNPEIRKG
jgi:hypothetical protein